MGGRHSPIARCGTGVAWFFGMIMMVNQPQVFYHDGRVGTGHSEVFELPRVDGTTKHGEFQDPDTLAKGGDGG